MVVDRLIEAVIPPTPRIGEIIAEIVRKVGMDSIDLLSCLSRDDWKSLIKENEGSIEAILLTTDSLTEGSNEQNTSESSNSTSTAAKTTGQSAGAKIDEITFTQLKCYGEALTREAKRWGDLSKASSPSKPNAEKDAVDDTMLQQMIASLAERSGQVPSELVPSAKVLKLLKKSPATYVDFRMLCESGGENPRKKFKTTVTGEVVEIYDDDDEKEDGSPRRVQQKSRAKTVLTLGEWMVCFPRYVVALAMVDDGCRDNILALSRYQIEVGRVAARANWQTVLKIEREYRLTVRSLVATGVDLWKCYGKATYTTIFFTQKLSETTFVERLAPKKVDQYERSKKGKGKGRSQQSRNWQGSWQNQWQGNWQPNTQHGSTSQDKKAKS
ncbi:hypothetical protein Pmar_PMAR017605 [Perkinsus marinus ATCC 50983]|uniref:Uncharacterized protein n=1 Tax=Perkinsus marinus (strain ATCC 50983 / TXsc) TaxID=423536 RepID=C5L3H4_PERM5|nr:hypothetical protein Pmar_PMAR017605 [Perkinsus marinus ATCC 50983]EER08553.1 hypothetical protein Pmar_PMAR017605 [Perkinsus marinus ATCC 50983]|eukprot:XP_002776737.1 hypothetical protein Pmar_PMAR017605 [Perkinsus marinus ATCC 50983]